MRAGGTVQVDPYTFTNGTVANATEVNLRFTRLYTLQNAAIDSTNMNLAAVFTWTGLHRFNGGLVVKRTAYAVTGTTGTNDVIVAVTDTSATRTITIATALIASAAGRFIIVKDEYGAAGTNNITVDCEGGQTIDGILSLAIAEDYGSMKLYSDGTNLFIAG